MANPVFVLAAFLCVLGSTSAQGADKTLQEGASGFNVVQVVVNRIIAVFGNDNQFLRRVAYVESKDGTDSDTYRSNYHGGIWQVDEIAFQSTQDVSTFPALSLLYNNISENFGIDWRNVQWMDLRKPLFSGIAARLFISNNFTSIPCDIAGQATYWKTYYNRNGADTEEMFISDAQNLSQIQGCRVNSDIMFVLDVSGSIGFSNFEQIRAFVLQFVSRISIGPMDNQVGVILFNTISRLIFDLDTHSSSSSLLNAINNIIYTGGGTNIPAALCGLYQVYTSSDTGARMDNSVFRIAIVMTDGRSNGNSNPCGFSSVEAAARAVHGISPRVLVFAFGVGSRFNSADIMVIASGPEFVSSTASFSTSELQCVQATQEDNLCYRISTPVNLESMNMGSLQQGEQVRWQFDVPVNGITFSLTVNEGRVECYASTQTTAPNDAFYEWKLATSSTSSVRIMPSPGSNANMNGFDNATVPVFMTIIGTNELNAFSLQSSMGARPRTQSSCKVMPSNRRG